MKYLVVLLFAASLVALYIQVQAWEKRRIFFVEQVAHLSQSTSEKRRALKLDIIIPEEKDRLTMDVERMRDQSYEYNRLIIEELRTKPFGLPLNGSEQSAMADARARMQAIEKEKEDERLDRMQASAAAEARRRADLERLAPKPPKPGDWMWQNRTVTPMDKAYR